MEDQRNCILDWPYFYHGKSTEELSQSLLLTTLELETTRVRAQEELRVRDDQLNQLKELLHKAISDRDEAQNRCQALLLEKLLLQQQHQQYQHHNHHHKATTAPPHSGISSIEFEDEPINNGSSGFSSSDCEESIVSSPIAENPAQLQPLAPPQPLAQPSFDQELPFPVVPTKALPEKGKFLEAVRKAGPLLQNLLLAGPLPLWRHPPPPLDTYEIPPPPVVVPIPPPPPPAYHLLNQESLLSIANSCCRFNKKRGFSSEGSDSSTETKYPRVALN